MKEVSADEWNRIPLEQNLYTYFKDTAYEEISFLVFFSFFYLSIFLSTHGYFFTEFVTMNVMLLCRWLKINPDNVATQTVGSLGDLVSLVFFSSVSDFIFKSGNKIFCVIYVS